ncbi:MAG: WG repeat-containing protein [Bacteroides sp.]|nr:WG repeat-containing protein [Bacteroides sp.]MCM1413325.1 WG repeat-containing protein [Bacteroides sp.]MCM1471989.1 WG repeat-containing protein [Bacteroides sp.]
MTTKNILFAVIILCLAAMVGLTSCDRSDSGTIAFIPVKDNDSGDWMLINSHGESIEADSMLTVTAPTMAINGFFTMRDDAGIMVMKVDGNHAEPLNGCLNIAAAGIMTEGRMPIVRTNSRISLIDGHGKEVATLDPIDGNEIDAVMPYFTSSRMIFRMAREGNTGLYGAIDTDGNVVVDAVFDRLYPYRGEWALAVIDTISSSKLKKKNHTYHLVDRRGNIKLTLPDKMKPLAEGVYGELMPVQYADTLGFINTGGRFRAVADEVKKIIDATDHVFSYKNKAGHMGVMTIEGDTILPAVFKDIILLGDRHFFTLDADGNGVVYDRNQVILSEHSGLKSIESLRRAYPFVSEFNCIAKTTANTYIIYDSQYGETEPMEFAEISTRTVIDPVSTDVGDMIASDYFDIILATSQFIKPLTLNGYSPATIGGTVQRLTASDAEKLVDTYSLRFYSDKGQRYNIRATAYTSASIATKEAVYDDHSDEFLGFLFKPELTGYSYSFNPKAKINKILLQLTTESSSFTQTRRAIESSILDKGYRTISQTQTYSIFSAGPDVSLILLAAPMQKGSLIYLLDSSGYSSNLSAIKREADINYAL